MRRAILGLLVALTVTGCASQIMKGYVGKPLQEAMVQYGPPQNAFDMGDGRRAFQWSMENSYTTPTFATNSGTAIPIGNSVYWTQNTQISGGQPITQKCVYTLYARWSESAHSWIVEGFAKPRYMCE